MDEERITMDEETTKKERRKRGWDKLGILDRIVFVAAVLVGMWKTSNTVFLVTGGCGVLVIILCIMMHCFCLEKVSGLVRSTRLWVVMKCSFHLWCGCLLGLISFIGIDSDPVREILFTRTTVMLIISMAIKVSWSAVQRFRGLVSYSSQLLSWAEICEVLGFSIACFLQSQVWFFKYSVLLMLFACALTLISIRLKVIVANPCGLALLICVVVFAIYCLNLSLNNAALICFVVRLFVDPIFDLFSSYLSTMERRDVVFSAHRWVRKIFLLVILFSNVIFFVHTGVSAICDAEWYTVVTFIILVLYWLCLRIVCIITCWEFTKKLTHCNSVRNPKNDLGKVMASNGMRLFALFARDLIAATFASSCLLGLVIACLTIWPLGGMSWQDPAFMASCMTVLLMEGMVYGVLYELASSVGGTCTSIVIMDPCSDLDQPMTTIQTFFRENVIPSRCDSFINGLTLKDLKSKLSHFFNQKKSDEIKFDTYVVYYCGNVKDSGNWTLAANETFKFETILELWEKASSEGFQSRLILIQDAKSSKQWMKQIPKNTNKVIAMQTCIMNKSKDPEEASVGDFTDYWVQFNSKNSRFNWKENGRNVKAIYAVSQLWSEFELHCPTEEDIIDFMKQNFPQRLHSLIKLILVANIKDDKISCCSLKRCMMKWCPPPVIDTGHGFKLVNS